MAKKRDDSYSVRLTRTKPTLFDEKLKHSIELLQKSERLALSMNEKGFYLAFSGGKDSQALYHVTQMAGVKFYAEYTLTTLEPPELVWFIRRQYPEVKHVRPKLTFLKLCEKKGALPTMKIRFCCAELKEVHGAGSVTLTGVRKQESVKRSKRTEVEKISRKMDRKFRGTLEQWDEFTRSKEVEGVQCVRGKDKLVVNPIIDWTEEDVWYFLNEVARVEHCELYDQGWKRIGCLFCPMSSEKSVDRDSERYPKFKAAVIRTIQKLIESGGYSKIQAKLGRTVTAEEMFGWWKSKKSADEYFKTDKKDDKNG